MTLQTKSGSYAPESYGDNIAAHLPQIASTLDGTTGAYTIRRPIVRLGVSTLMSSMELIGRSIDVDRIHIWRREESNSKIRYNRNYLWFSEIGKQRDTIPPVLEFIADEVSVLTNRFVSGGYINGVISELSMDEMKFLLDYDIKSIIMLHLFIGEQF